MIAQLGSQLQVLDIHAGRNLQKLYSRNLKNLNLILHHLPVIYRLSIGAEYITPEFFAQGLPAQKSMSSLAELEITCHCNTHYYKCRVCIRGFDFSTLWQAMFERRLGRLRKLVLCRLLLAVNTTGIQRADEFLHRMGWESPLKEIPGSYAVYSMKEGVNTIGV